MVVGYFAVVKYFLGLGQLVSKHWLGKSCVRLHGLHDARDLGVDVVAQESGVDTWIGRDFFLIKRLNKSQGLVGTVTKLFIAFHLQTG